MTQPTTTTIETILADYASGKRDFRGANLTSANLTSAYLARANLARADLAGADLAGANLASANLTGANLAGANLARADLTRAYLTDANLTGATLTRAYLTRANLAGANLPTASHDVISEILHRAAGEDISCMMLAGLVLLKRDWCWERFAEVLASRDALRIWAIQSLAPWECFHALLKQYSPDEFAQVQQQQQRAKEESSVVSNAEE